MARVTCEAPVKYLQGKVSKSDNTIFRVLHGVCRLYRQLRYADPKSGTAAQKAAVNAFRTAVATVNEILADADALRAYEAQFRAQTKYKTLRTYIFAQVYTPA